MRLFWTFFWTFLLVQMATYVMGSMQGTGYDFATGALLGDVTVLVLVVAALIPDEPAGDHRH